jgi:hypothetical protein
MVFAGIIFLLLGAAIWQWSRVGFAVGGHPHCRACGFDLYKLPEDSRRCSECGADVLADDAITIGRRRPAAGGMAAGAMGLLMGAVLLGLGGWSWWREFDGSRFKSVAMLERDMTLRDAPTRARAGAELERRIDGHVISARQMEQIAQEALLRQTDPKWEPRWGDLMQAGHRAPSSTGGPLLADSQWTRFVQQGMEISVRIRPRVRLGDPIPIGVACRLKVGTKWPASAMTLAPEVAMACGEVSGRLTDRALACDFPVPLEWTVHWMPEKELAAGMREVNAAVTITAREGSSTIARTMPFTMPIEVLDRSSSSVTLRAASAEGQRDMEAALHWRLREEEDGTISLGGGALGKLWVGSPPLTAAFRVVLRQGEGTARQEWLIGRFMVQPGNAATVPLGFPSGGGPAPGEAEVVCIPDAALAAGTVDVLEVWGGEVTRKITLAP